MDELGSLFWWVSAGLFTYSFPPMLLVYIWINDYKSPSTVIFSSRKDAVYSLLVGLPCSIFTFEMFYASFYKLSYIRDIVFGLKLYRFFDITIMSQIVFFISGALICFVIAIIYNGIFAMKYNKSLLGQLASLICRVQISIMPTVCLFTFLGMFYYYWGHFSENHFFGFIWTVLWFVSFVPCALLFKNIALANERDGAQA